MFYTKSIYHNIVKVTKYLSYSYLPSTWQSIPHASQTLWYVPSERRIMCKHLFTVMKITTFLILVSTTRMGKIIFVSVLLVVTTWAAVILILTSIMQQLDYTFGCLFGRIWKRNQVTAYTNMRNSYMFILLAEKCGIPLQINFCVHKHECSDSEAKLWW